MEATRPPLPVLVVQRADRVRCGRLASNRRQDLRRPERPFYNDLSEMPDLGLH